MPEAGLHPGNQGDQAPERPFAADAAHRIRSFIAWSKPLCRATPPPAATFNILISPSSRANSCTVQRPDAVRRKVGALDGKPQRGRAGKRFRGGIEHQLHLWQN